MAAVGDEVGDRYVLRARLGGEGAGSVWLADDTLLDRKVALKSPRPRNRRAVARLRTEAQNAAKLRHPGLVAVYDLFEEAAVHWLVREYVPGPSLARVLSEGGPLPPAEAAKLGREIAEALAHAHSLGVAHRDVTPENILFTAKKAAKLGDFGISVDLHGAAGPETSQGQSDDCAADVFSLGATIYVAVTGHPPNADGTKNIEPPPEAVGGARDSARKLYAVLRRLMATAPRRRPTAAEAANLFAQVNRPDSGGQASGGSWLARLGLPRRSARPAE